MMLSPRAQLHVQRLLDSDHHLGSRSTSMWSQEGIDMSLPIVVNYDNNNGKKHSSSRRGSSSKRRVSVLSIVKDRSMSRQHESPSAHDRHGQDDWAASMEAGENENSPPTDAVVVQPWKDSPAAEGEEGVSASGGMSVSGPQASSQCGAGGRLDEAEQLHTCTTANQDDGADSTAADLMPLGPTDTQPMNDEAGHRGSYGGVDENGGSSATTHVQQLDLAALAAPRDGDEDDWARESESDRHYYDGMEEGASNNDKVHIAHIDFSTLTAEAAEPQAPTLRDTEEVSRWKSSSRGGSPHAQQQQARQHEEYVEDSEEGPVTLSQSEDAQYDNDITSNNNNNNNADTPSMHARDTITHLVDLPGDEDKGRTGSLPATSSRRLFSLPHEDPLGCIEINERDARWRLCAEQDMCYITILEWAEGSLLTERDSVLSHTSRSRRRSQSGLLAVSGGGHGFAGNEESLMVCLQQEREIGELRSALTNADERIAVLEDTIRALRLQLVLEKATRKK